MNPWHENAQRGRKRPIPSTPTVTREPGETMICTAVPGSSIVRTGSPVRFRRGLHYKPAGQAGFCTRSVACPRAVPAVCRDLPVRFVRCESVPVACRGHFEMSLAAGSRQGIRSTGLGTAGCVRRTLGWDSPSKQAALAQALTAEWMHPGSCSWTEPSSAAALGPPGARPVGRAGPCQRPARRSTTGAKVSMSPSATTR